MNPEIEGRGGGFGKYQGLTLAETQALFDTCTADPSMRSISAVLRITREQLDARGQLGTYPVFGWIAGAAVFVGALARQLGPKAIEPVATKTLIGAGVVCVLIVATTWVTRNTRKTNMAQEREIREMAVRALVTLLESKPKLKPLSVEQETTVKILLRKSPAAGPLRELLEA